ncbi:MAG: protocatechuate 3,4-dioxygenase subunit alpha [Proteobacteria bacterium]|nr:protocatechuate 3,4-dioxygenase subunit alpha [Pseudomonadota bacterium]
MGHIPTPSQTVGPYLAIGLKWLTTTDLARGAAGDRIAISGSLLDGDGKPIPDALLDLWQANSQGKYTHPEDQQAKALDPAFFGFGRVPTDKSGAFRFTTIKPGPVPGLGNSLQAPHIVVCLFMRGLLKQLFTRIYFSDEAANGTDPVLGSIDDAARRETLIAQRVNATGDYRWNIQMQGDRETVFFDCG